MAKIFNKSRLISTTVFTVALVVMVSIYRLPNVAQAITPTPSASTQCAQITLSVSPVVSPTTSTTQTINMSASGGGLYQFNVYQRDSSGNLVHSYSNNASGSTAAITINLFSGSNILTVSVNGEVGCTGPSGPFTTFVTTQTTTATDGSALVIVQSSDGTPYSGTPYAIPGKVEAENFNKGGEGVAYHDVDTTNNGGQYRTSEGVDIETTSDSGGGYNVGWTAAGEWMKYTVNVASSGKYIFDFREASNVTGGSFHMEVDNVNVTGSLTASNTGGWQAWTDVFATNVNLTAGQHIFKLVTDAGGGNYNWFTVTAAIPPTFTPTAASSVDGAPYGGTPAAIPGTVQAENFNTGGEGVAYHDVDATNNGGQYRTSEGVDIETTPDSGGGFDIGWTATGEWMKYTVNVASSGSYTADFRVASPNTGSAFHLEVDGSNVTGSVTVPNTGGWQTWADVTKSGINLSAGQHVLRLVTDAGGMNYNWFKLIAAALPDLTVSSIFIAPSTGCNNILGTQVTVKNIGTADAASFVVQLAWGSSTTGATQTVSGLAAGQSIAVRFVGDQGGSATATADSTNVIAESNETNNSLTAMVPVPTQPVTCTPSYTPTFIPADPTLPNLPDLTLSISQGIFDDCRSLAPHGVTVTVHNIGNANAGPFVVRATGANVLDQSVDGLAAGQSINLFFNVSPPNGAISSFADSTFVIVELNEMNNSGTYLAPTLTPRIPCPASPTYTPGGPTVTNTPSATPSKTPLPSATPTRPIIGS